MHCIILKVQALSYTFLDKDGAQNRYGMIQYYFDGPEVEIKIKPHGNSKSAAPFFRTSESAKKLHKELAATHMPKEVVYQATLMQGGEIEARGMSCLQRNRQQIANYRRVEKKRDDNVLYSVMLECKLAQGTLEAFVRDVKAAPDPQCILFFDWQIADMERFVTRATWYLNHRSNIQPWSVLCHPHYISSSNA